MSKCPDKNLPEFQEMSNILGDKIATSVWVSNNGYPLTLSPNGKESKLYKDLLAQHGGDVTKAIVDKAKVHSISFKEWFGDWVNTSERGTLEEDRIKVEKVLPKEDLDRLDNLDKELEILKDNTETLEKKVSVIQSILNFLDKIVLLIKNDIKSNIKEVIDTEGIVGKIYTALNILENHKIKHYLPKKATNGVTGIAKVLRAAMDTVTYYTVDVDKDNEETSKIVDTNGEPLIVYHGSSETFVEFDKGKIKRSVMGEGFNFSSSKRVATQYTKKDGKFGKSRVLPSYLNVKNPYEFDGREAPEEFDGVVGTKTKNTIYIAKKPDQIKSAIAPTEEQINEFNLESDKIGTFKGSNVYNSERVEESKAYTEKSANQFNLGTPSLSIEESDNVLKSESSILESDVTVIEDGSLEEEFDPKITKAINEIDNRIKSLQLGIRKASNEEEIFERIENLRAKRAEMEKEGALIAVVEAAKEGLDWVRSKILTKTEIYANDVVLADQELSTVKLLLSDILQYDSADPKTGKPTYNVKNEGLIKKAVSIQEDIATLNNRITSLRRVQLQNMAFKKYGEGLSMDDLTSIKDVNLIKSRALDSSRFESKLIKMLTGVMIDVDKNVMNEFDNEITKGMKSLIEETGLDITTETVQDIFRQKDKDGNNTGNYIHEHSQEYLDFIYDISWQLNSIKGNELSKYLANKRIALFKKFTSNVVFPDFDKLFTVKATEQSMEEERDRLVDLVGETSADRVLKQAEIKWDNYLKAKVNMERSLQLKGDSGVEGFKTEEDRSKALSNWVSFKHPSNLTSNLQAGIYNKTAIGDVKRFLPFAPLKSVDGKATKWYDKGFDYIKQNPDTYGRVYDYLLDGMDKYKQFLPPDIASRTQENYMPEITKDMMSEMLKGKGMHVLSGANLLDKALDSIASGDAEVDYALRDSRQQPIKSVPIKFVNDTLGRLRNQVSKLDTQIAMQQVAATNLEAYEGEAYTEEERKEKLESLEEGIRMLKEKRDSLDGSYRKALSKKSLDPFAAYKAFVMMAMNYKRKSAVEDIINIGQQVVEEADEIATNALNTAVKDIAGKFVKVDKGKMEISKQFDFAVGAIMYDKYKADKGATNTPIGVTKEARVEIRDIKKKIKANRKAYFDGKLKAAEYEEIDTVLRDEFRSVSGGRSLSLGKIVDKFIKLTYMTSLGWNPISAGVNVAYGAIANSIEGAAGKYYTNREYRRATGLLTSATKKSLGFKDNETSNKIRNVMGNYAVMFDLLEDAYGSGKSLDSIKKKFGLANPMEMFKRGEYFNQAGVLVAMLLHKKVTLNNGEEISLWDAYDSDGNISKNVKNREQWMPEYDALKGNSFTKFRNQAVQLIKRTHGNYDPSSPLYAKETAIGRAISLFKTWNFEGVATRTETSGRDYQLGDQVKGRYRTFKDLGFYGSVKVIKEVLAKNYLKSKKGEIDFSSEESQLDFENVARNLKEIQWMLTMLGLFIVANLAFDDDDEKTEGYKTLTMLIGRMQSDITLYMTPQGMADLWKNPTPIFRTMDELVGAVTSVYDYTFSDSPNHDLDYMIKNVSDPIPGVKLLF